MSPFDTMREKLGLVDPSKQAESASVYTLERYLTRRRIGLDAGLNILQQHGVISDHCEYCQDVYPGDQIKAVKWLEKNVWRDKYDRLKITSQHE